MQFSAFIFATEVGDSYLADRTLRSFQYAGIDAKILPFEKIGNTLETIRASSNALLLARAGTWFARQNPFQIPPSSATGRPLCAVGNTVEAVASGSSLFCRKDPWKSFLRSTGGDLISITKSGENIPTPSMVFMDARAAAAFRANLNLNDLFDQQLRVALSNSDWRVVHFSPLDVCLNQNLRIIQLITSLQKGGAEKISLHLATELARWGTRTLIVTLGNPCRTAFPLPRNSVDLSKFPRDPNLLAAEIRRISARFGADLIHGHLIDTNLASRISRSDLPLLLTVHNQSPGWPIGLANLASGDAALLFACSRAVEVDLVNAHVPLPIRTIWNGIDPSEFRRTSDHLTTGRAWRNRFGISESDYVLIAIANPRPQKRLHLLPAIAAATRSALSQRGLCSEVHVIIVGEASQNHRDAQDAVAQIRGQISIHGLDRHVHWAGGVDDVAGILAAGDALVTTSAHEGLSLAQLEALAMGLPVVTSDVGGAREISAGHRGMVVLPTDAKPEQFAEALVQLDQPLNEKASELAPSFTRHRMAERYQWLYRRTISAARHSRRKGLLLVTNNFSTGGAQTSARRLLNGLAENGVNVRAAVLQELPELPTVGRTALTNAGISVLSLSNSSNGTFLEQARELLEFIDADPPEVILFWNALPVLKILLSDALWQTRIFDVSPGEMFFSAFDRYFANPLPGLPYRSAKEYGARLDGVIVKFSGEATRAAETLGRSVHVIPNGVPTLPQVDHVKDRTSDRTVIGTCARLNPHKRLDDLLDALRAVKSRLPPFELRIAGEIETGFEDYASSLRERANDLPVEWLGEVTDIFGFLRETDIFAMISEPAGCPNASLEAMAAGLPIIATDVGGACEQILHGETGLLAPPREPAPFGEALLELVVDRNKRIQFGDAARRRAHESFSVERMVRDYRRVCEI